MAVLEEGADKASEEGWAGFVNPLPDVVGYCVGAGGVRARRFSERGGDLLLTQREVVSKAGEVNGGLGRGWGGRKEVVQEGRGDAFQGVFGWKGGEVGLLPPACEFLSFPYR